MLNHTGHFQIYQEKLSKFYVATDGYYFLTKLVEVNLLTVPVMQ